MRTSAIDPCLLQPLENVIRYKFLPAITGKGAFSDTERVLLALLVRLRGLGIVNPIRCGACLELSNWWLPHNEFRDITASLMTEVCHGVAVELTLQTLSGEQMALNSAITT